MRTHLIYLLLFSSGLLSAQASLSTSSKKAADYYYQADNFWVRGQYNLAVDLLEKAIQKDKNFHEAYFRLGVILKAKDQLDIAESHLIKTKDLNDGMHAGALFELGELYVQKGEYEKAIVHIDDYLKLNPRNQKRISEAEKIKADARFAIENINLASEFNPRPLSPQVNQFAMQYFPVITADQSALIFTRRLGTSMNHDEDLVICYSQEEGSWSPPVSISKNINSDFNEGTCTISADGRVLIFTSCLGRQGYGSCDLFISKKNGDDWTVPENLGSNINTPYWESQPSLAADGRTLYFVSNRPNGIGERDIWMSSLDDNENWSKPINLGNRINTPRDEVSPFIHANSQTLYFASNGRIGFGGYDIFYTEISNDVWNEPINLGSPVNTGEDQVSLFITADGKKGYYSHEDRGDGERKGEIYMFDVPESIQVENKTTYIKGIVYDEKSKQPIRAAIELFDLNKDKRVSKINSDSISGKYLMVLTEGSNYALYIDKKGYLFHSLSFRYDTTQGYLPIVKDIYLSPVKTGAKVTLNNVFFEHDSYELKDESRTELNKVIRFLNENPGMRIEISGHTDNVGDQNYNKILSLKRALSVYNYLIKNNISEDRLAHIGHGQLQPIASNNTSEGRMLNRRIEFRVLND